MYNHFTGLVLGAFCGWSWTRVYYLRAVRERDVYRAVLQEIEKRIELKKNAVDGEG